MARVNGIPKFRPCGRKYHLQSKLSATRLALLISAFREKKPGNEARRRQATFSTDLIMYDISQGVVTYMSRVEVFATGIKIESSDQSPFERLIKGSM